MKITPLAGGSGSPGTLIGAVDIGSSTSADKKENAKRAFKGEAPVLLNQSDTPTGPVENLRLQKKRVLKMRTNATPGYIPPEEEIAAAPEPEPAISAPTEQTPANEETKPLSPQFAALARQKRALQQERAAFEKERAEFKTQQPQGSSISLDRLKTDTMSVLQEAGILDSSEFYNSLTDRIMGNPQSAVSPEIEALRKENKELRESIDKKFEERDTESEKAVLREIGKDAERMVYSSDEYKAIRATKSVPEAVELIRRTWKKHGEVLDTAEALKLVEQDLREQISPIAKELGFQSAAAPAQQQQPQQRQMKTLTNRDGSVALLTPKQRAIMAFEGKLRKV